MKTLTVYRLEHKEHKRGPFQCDHSHRNEIGNMQDDEWLEKHPYPAYDFRHFVDVWSSNIHEYVFAAPSIKKLHEWFPNLLEKMLGEEFMLLAITLPRKKVLISKSCSQVAFKREYILSTVVVGIINPL